jgi:hypothetical protein
MFFNYDSFEIVALAFVVSGIFTYSFYKNSAPIISESSLDNVETANRVYDMSNIKDVLDLMIDPTVVFSNDPVAGGVDLLTFYTADSANEILRSTLEALLISVN